MRRTQPWLGTLVTVAVHGATGARAEALCRRAFAAIARVHALMSFHEPNSDVSRLNREAWRSAVSVDALTFDVLRLARRISTGSDGVFDVSVAPRLVASTLLPRPPGAPQPDLRARWQDIQLLRGRRVRFTKPLWVDLGGIAKGYAVDAALRAAGPLRRATLSINAGGDLRVAGPQALPVALAVVGRPEQSLPQLRVSNAAVASSQGLATSDRRSRNAQGPHRHGRTRRPAPAARFVTVVADRCAIADALTKVVIARGRAAAPVLRQFGAEALICEPGRGWQRIGVRR